MILPFVASPVALDYTGRRQGSTGACHYNTAGLSHAEILVVASWNPGRSTSSRESVFSMQ